MISLREAINYAGTGGLGNEITFSNAVFDAENHTLTLGEDEIIIDKDIVITGLDGIGINLTANTSANINVYAGKKLTINNINTDNKVNVNLKSDATGDAVLIHNSQIYGTMERYMNGDNQWHFLSSPVVNQDISDGNFACAKINDAFAFNYDFYLYDEKNYLWKNYKNTDEATGFYASNNNSGNFVVGRGYITAYEAAQGETSVTKTFSGKFNQGNVTISLSYNSSFNNLKGFNLVGNPYPNAIDWNASGWTRDALGADPSFYVFDNNGSATNPRLNYAVYYFNSETQEGVSVNGGTNIIAPNQGFFVKAEQAGNLIMTNAIRTSSSATYRDEAEKDDALHFIVSGNKCGSDEVAILFANSVIQSETKNPEFTGAEKLFSDEDKALSLYLPANGTDYCILKNRQARGSQPMSFAAGINGFYTINLNSDVSRFDFLELEDLQEDVKVNLLNEDKYTFTGNLGDNPNRFRINFIISGEDNDDVIGNEPVIYVSNGDLIMENIIGSGVIEVIDIQGRIIRKYNASGDFRKNINIVEGVYLVRVIDGSGVNVKKIFYR